ncbi:MAG TPA: 50S ribosomal protein L23 [Candidatus Omnitrophota bacterium]|nr:50S ribosomal protein L23 [Candidatus Omnitrophota bacterium]HRK61340.1 50S ribosomal protein L23 [Candidatus Omnitrophota bacterium]
MKLHMYDVILEPVVTEKAARESEKFSKYAFKVHRASNKKQIKSAVEKFYNVHVTKINTINYDGKQRRLRAQPGLTASWKKATVTLKKGEKIDFTK